MQSKEWMNSSLLPPFVPVFFLFSFKLPCADMVADSLYVQHILKEKEEKKNRERTGSVQMRRVGEILLA